MKKLLFFSVIALAAVVSCGQKPDTPAEVPPASTEKYAVVATIPESAPKILLDLRGDKRIELISIEFMRDGDYVGKGNLLEPNQAPVKASGGWQHFSGKFTVAESTGIYDLTGDFKGKVAIQKDDNKPKLIVTPFQGDEQKTDCTTTVPTPVNEIEKALCVSWVPTSLEVVVKTPAGSTVKHKFTEAEAKDLLKIAKFVNANQSEVKLDEKKFENHVISSIALSPAPARTVSVNFVATGETGPDPVVGTYTNLNLTNKTFSYTLDAELDGKLFKANADGSFEFNSTFTTLTLKLTIKTDALTGDITITAKRV